MCCQGNGLQLGALPPPHFTVYKSTVKIPKGINLQSLTTHRSYQQHTCVTKVKSFTGVKYGIHCVSDTRGKFNNVLPKQHQLLR